MVGANLKSETMKLMDKRTTMEAEMNAIIEQLCQPGGPGLSGNLVDPEVFSFSLYLEIHLFLFTSISFLGFKFRIFSIS